MSDFRLEDMRKEAANMMAMATKAMMPAKSRASQFSAKASGIFSPLRNQWVDEADGINYSTALSAASTNSVTSSKGWDLTIASGSDRICTEHYFLREGCTMGLDVGVVTFKYLERPRGGIKDFLVFLAENADEADWQFGNSTNIMVEYYRKNLLALVHDYVTEHRPDIGQDTEIRNWVDALPWKENTVMLHIDL